MLLENILPRISPGKQKLFTRLFARQAAIIGLSLILALTVSVSADARGRQTNIAPAGSGGAQNGPDRVLPSLVRQVIHNKGNIVTTIDNWGLIGGYSFISSEDYPSGEWPKNSGHSYIAEIKYWMGAITAAGDTVVANTNDDFQPTTSFQTGDEAYNILLSTDSLSYSFDPLDTVGVGAGSAANGWRVWNSDSAAWVYNQVYVVADSAFVPGGPVAVQESHYRFNDAARGTPALNLEMTQTIYQWNYCYNENFMFVVLDIKNVSGEDYNNFAFGLYCDLDVGGLNVTSGENGRLEDVVDYDTANGLAWTYDVTGYDQGWQAETGVMGTKYLQTPDDLGMTSFRTGIWDLLPLDPDEDPGRYDLIASTQFDTPLPPDDQYYLQCTNGINLLDGKTVRVVFAIVAGADENEFRDNASLAQTLYDNFFVGPEPPPTPTLSVRQGNGRNYLSWDNLAESFVDPLSQVQDFKGYRLYRSVSLGQSWGADPASSGPGGACQSVNFEPIATFRVDSPGDPVAHSFIDTQVENGWEYWYCLAAFDSGDTLVPIEPLQNSFGTPGVDRNVVMAMPNTNPAGYFSAQSTVMRGSSTDTSAGLIWPIILDQTAAGKHVHKVGFYEDDFATYWALVDTVTGDTLLTDQTTQFAYNETAVDSLTSFFPIVNGIQVAVFNGERTPEDMSQTGFAGSDTTLAVDRFYGTVLEAFGMPISLAGGDGHFRSDYEIRFTAGGSVGADLYDDVTPMTMPFEIWNTTTNQRLIVEVYDFAANGVYDAADGDLIAIIDFPYDGLVHPEAFPVYHVWLFALDPTAASLATPGDVFRITGAPLNGPSDEFFFSPDGVNLALASQELPNIKVAPNPYVARAEWENTTTPTRLHFIHLPGECVLRIYTLAGDLVKTIDHNTGAGDASWDLISESGQQIASGVYFYHVESDAGEFLGRFAVIN